MINSIRHCGIGQFYIVLISYFVYSKTNFIMKRILIVFATILLFTAGCQGRTESNTNNGISPSAIVKTIDRGKPVVISNKIITGDLDFTEVKSRSIYSSSGETAGIGVPVTFLNCIFMGTVRCNSVNGNRSVNTRFESSLTFEACDFRGEADLSNSTVMGDVNFTEAIFREKASFNNMHLNGKVAWFTGIQAEQPFSMQEALFNGRADFFKASFAGKASFQGSDFRGAARFSNLDCSGRCDFSLVRFRDDAQFSYARFAGGLNILDSRFSGTAFLNNIEFAGQSIISGCTFFGMVSFEKSAATSGFDLSNSYFINGRPKTGGFMISNPTKLNTSGTKFADLHDLTPLIAE